jgi:outer membrane protein assembly factor BamA
MKFDLLRFHQAVLRKIWGALYVGLGVRIDRYFAIRDELLDLSAPSPVVTSHYAYSVHNGFDPSQYTLLGVTLDVLYDSRDSTINAYRGYYARVAVGGFPTWLGSSKASTMVVGDIRAYVGLSDDVPRNVLAFWVLAAGVTSGVQPYLTLPSVGWDADGTTGRGYVQGRFRGTAMLYAEAEWRFRISNNGLFGGAVFVNAETMSSPAFNYLSVNEPAINMFKYVKPAGGVGARIMLSKESRTTLRLDVAMGVDSFGIYLGAGEAF